MAITIKDVAQLANVAPSTVSRVIANDPRISEKTKVRVSKVMEKLGYHPNLLHVVLLNNQPGSLGLCCHVRQIAFIKIHFFRQSSRVLVKGLRKSITLFY